MLKEWINIKKKIVLKLPWFLGIRWLLRGVVGVLFFAQWSGQKSEIFGSFLKHYGFAGWSEKHRRSEGKRETHRISSAKMN